MAVGLSVDTNDLDSVVLQMAHGGYVVALKTVGGITERHIFTNHTEFHAFVQEIIGVPHATA